MHAKLLCHSWTSSITHSTIYLSNHIIHFCFFSNQFNQIKMSSNMCVDESASSQKFCAKIEQFIQHKYESLLYSNFIQVNATKTQYNIKILLNFNHLCHSWYYHICSPFDSFHYRRFKWISKLK
jgi:hypothetical protein